VIFYSKALKVYEFDVCEIWALNIHNTSHAFSKRKPELAPKSISNQLLLTKHPTLFE
jgi:hypothetical protein